MNRIYLSLLVSILLSSCFLEKENCDKMTKITLEDNYNLILNSRPELSSSNFDYHYKLQGKDLKTHKDTLIKVYNYRWYGLFYYYWNKGDTLIKNKGSLKTEIHKKDTIYYMEWNCKDPLINEISSSSVNPPIDLR